MSAQQSAESDARRQIDALATALTHEIAVLLRNPCETDDRHGALVTRSAVRLALIRDDLRSVIPPEVGAS